MRIVRPPEVRVRPTACKDYLPARFRRDKRVLFRRHVRGHHEHGLVTVEDMVVQRYRTRFGCVVPHSQANSQFLSADGRHDKHIRDRQRRQSAEAHRELVDSEASAGLMALGPEASAGESALPRWCLCRLNTEGPYRQFIISTGSQLIGHVHREREERSEVVARVFAVDIHGTCVPYVLEVQFVSVALEPLGRGEGSGVHTRTRPLAGPELLARELLGQFVCGHIACLPSHIIENQLALCARALIDV